MLTYCLASYETVVVKLQMLLIQMVLYQITAATSQVVLQLN